MQPQTIESGVQLFSRINHSTSNFNNINSKLFKNEGPRANETIEITGNFSQDLLVDFLMRCILPKDFGLGMGAVLIHCGHHMGILRITRVMDAFLKSLRVENRKEVIEEALKNVIILNCYDDEKVEITFLNLEKIVHNNDNINLLIVDDLIAQYWVSRQKNPKLSIDFYAKSNLMTIQSVIKNLNLVLVYSYHQLNHAVDLNPDYKITSDKIAGKDQFTVVDKTRKTSISVPFLSQTFITFL